jgi:hypothetical protein
MNVDGTLNERVRSDVLTAAKMSMLVFWVVTPCGLVGRYQSFGETVYIFSSPEL